MNLQNQNQEESNENWMNKEAKMDRPDLNQEVQTSDQVHYNFQGYFPEEEEEPNSFKKSWRQIWQIILGAYAAFLPVFAIMFGALLIAFLLIRLYLT